MKNIITQFANARKGFFNELINARQDFLNEPADLTLIAKFKERFNNSEEVNELLEIYKVFDGEQYQGVLLPELSISSLKNVIDLMDGTENVWEDWETQLEIDGKPRRLHPMRFFIPFIDTELQNSIGLLIKTNTKYDGYVIEYDYEEGEFIIWSKSLSAFIDALFSFSIEKMPVMLSPDDENYPFLPRDGNSTYSHDFTEQDIKFLSQWPEFVFPNVKDERYSVYESFT